MSRSRRGLWDPGAQPERTYQAWVRTALAVAGCGLLLSRLTVWAGAIALVLGALVLAAALVLGLVQQRRLRSGRISAAPRSVAALSAVVVAVAVLALTLLAVRGLGRA